MRLLFDHNLSPRLVSRMEDILRHRYPEIVAFMDDPTAGVLELR